MSENNGWKQELLTSVENEIELFQGIVNEISALTDELREYLKRNGKDGDIPVSYDKPSGIANATWSFKVGPYSHVFSIADVKKAQTVYVIDEDGFSKPEKVSLRDALIKIIKGNIPFSVN